MNVIMGRQQMLREKGEAVPPLLELALGIDPEELGRGTPGAGIVGGRIMV
jgi:hypothetical protein